MSSIGISNVPNRASKEMSEKPFSEFREGSINTTTRNFYQNYGHYDSQLESQPSHYESEYKNRNNAREGGTSE